MFKTIISNLNKHFYIKLNSRQIWNLALLHSGLKNCIFVKNFNDDEAWIFIIIIIIFIIIILKICYSFATILEAKI